MNRKLIPKGKMVIIQLNRRISLAVLTVLFLICLLLPVTAASIHRPNDGNSFAGNVVKKVLDNGLTILIKQTDANQVVAVDLFVKTGPLYESWDERGLSSLTQRVLTRGTATLSAREIAILTESSGSSIEAGVSGEYGMVSLSTTTLGFQDSFPIFCDIILNPIFADTEVENEKQLLLNELASREDQPFNSAYLAFIQAYYRGNPYGIDGTELANKVAQYSRSDVLSWYKRFYIPNNMVMTIVGNIEPQETLKTIEEKFGHLSQGKASKTIKFIESKRQSSNVKTKNTQALFLVLGYPAPSINSKDAPVMELISRILGEGEGRLYRELREKQGLAYTVFTGYQSSMVSPYIFTFIATAPANFDKVKNGIVAEFEKLSRELVSDEELNEAKMGLRGSYLMSHETNSDQSRILGRNELLGLGYGYDDRYLELINRVTPGDIQRVSRKYFKKFTIGAVSPVEIK